MPAFGVYPIADALTPGDEISSTYEGRHVTLLESELIHPSHTDGLVDKGDPVVFGTTALQAVGVAFASAAAATEFIAVDTEGIWNLDVVAADDGGNSAVEGGDRIYISITTGILSKIADSATNIPFGYALGHIDAGYTLAIAVKVHWDPICSWNLDDVLQYFGDSKDFSMEWNETYFSVVGASPSKVVGEEFAISLAALADGYGFKETNFNVTGAATGYVAGDSTWLNLAAGFTVLAGGGLITPHTDGIYDAGATITGATVALIGKFTEQMASADFGVYNLWNLNLTQEITALFEVNNPALIGYAAGSVSTVKGSIPFFSTGGSGVQGWIAIYDAEFA